MNRHPARSPLPRQTIEQAGTACSTRLTVSLPRQPPVIQHIPVAADQLASALMAVGAASGLVMDIAGVGIAQTVFHGDPARFR